MIDVRRLSSLKDVSGPARLPLYDLGKHGWGIVHLGVGAFHRAHQADYTDAALSAEGGDWRIIGASLRGDSAAKALNPQNGLYTLIERSESGRSGKVIASIERVIAAAREPDDLIACLSDPRTRVVTLTITEKGYGVVRSSMTIDPRHSAVAEDLRNPGRPVGALGLLTEALRRRRAARFEPFTVLCCDNLPDNGKFVRAGVVDFARRIDPALADWIAEFVSFPSSMVDRITPASTERTYKDALELTGCVDMAAVDTEPFKQWVVEDRFPTGRPAWDKVGVIFVDEVGPYETMKLRMLNGAHSMLAYAGFLAGHRYVSDTVGSHGFRRLVERHVAAAASTLPPLSAVDLHVYGSNILRRFSNTAIAHETYQIAMDGSEKLPQRIFAATLDAMDRRHDLRPFAFVVAAWMRYCLGRHDNGDPYRLRDPREEEIAQLLKESSAASDVCAALHGLPGLFPERLRADVPWRDAVTDRLAAMINGGMRHALDAEMRLAAAA